MLPSLGFNEIIVLGILALIVIGPKDLPLLLRKLGRWTAKLRGMAQEFRSGFDELARQAELDELRKEVDALRRTTSGLGQDMQREFNKIGETPKMESLRAPEPVKAEEPAAESEAVEASSEGEPSANAPDAAPEPAEEKSAAMVRSGA